MSISFGQIFLYSHNPAKLYNFLSFLLDVEAESYQDDKISFTFEGTNFLILLSERKKIEKTKVFSLSVTSQIDLDDLVQNINFYYYKESQKPQNIVQDGGSISFNDPDGRVWEVNLTELNSHALNPVANKSGNVRIC